MNRHNPASQRGMALISALLLLLVVTIMAVSMFRSYGMQEKIAGNTREKQRALNAAVSAQQYAEYWLSTGTTPATAACAGVVSSNVGQICNNALVDATNVPWISGGAPVGVTYTPFTANPINSISNNIQSTAPTVGSYYAAPLFYIADLGSPAGGGELYQIDAVGYGGTPNAVAVVESTYLITTPTARSPDK
ncbi:MAG TPA: PilX N-terminal domain-containing pilus assembly protein [Steroidobacteraceae bacterium]|nr:PilX N-terminal domain-containing pilus assembly protein [Steroidobacteraceae bacterium]